MISFPRAKINLGLRIIRKRPDSFHDIETVFYPLGLSDALELVVLPGKAVADDLKITGIDIGSDPDKNLVLTAIRNLRRVFPVPYLKIHLHKAIPVGAGLGGGSSDAASMLKSVNKCFNLSLNDEELRSYALELGSDCPFFIDPVPSLATGRGEELSYVTPFLEGLHIVLLNPGIRISTRDAYINSKPQIPEMSLDLLLKKDPEEWRASVKNDFEEYVFRIYPEIHDLKRSLYRSGALFASMSGSGSTIYGIFRDESPIPERLKKYIIYRGVL